MNKIIFFLGIILLTSCAAKESLIVKPQLITTDYDTTAYVLMQQDYLKKFNAHDSIIVFNSADIKVEETFCYILNKDSLSCISNKIKAYTPGLISKVLRKNSGGVKNILVSFPEKDYVYNCYFFKTKDSYNNEEYVLSGQVDLFFRGKIYKITASTVGICKILVKK